MGLTVPWGVTVNGQPMSDRWNPYIQSIECTDKAGDSGDTAILVFDDTDGQCMMPEAGSPVVITLRGVKVFEGVTDVPESQGSRGGGMELTVNCTGHDKRGKVKERLGLHKDDATLEEFLKEAANKAGLDGIKVDPELGKIKRPYWSTEGRHFLQLGRELAAELGATFKVRGKQAVFAKRGAGGAPGGGTMPTVRAVRGENLISWRLTPVETRPRYTKTRQRWYDRKSAKWEVEDVEVGTAPGAPEALDIGAVARADKDSAKRAAGGSKAESEREGGSGDVEVYCDVQAFAEGTCEVQVRPGVDGPYRIESRTHRVTRGPSITRMTLKQPQGSAGKDSRKSGGSGS